MGLPLERVLMDPNTGALGYGIEYTYSVMERLRLAALHGRRHDPAADDLQSGRGGLAPEGRSRGRGRAGRVGRRRPARRGLGGGDRP